jgi:3-oxoacyl-[acyl-carrier protein] reductase
VIQKMTDEQWYAILDCHLTAPFRILRAAQPVISAAAKAEAAEGRSLPQGRQHFLGAAGGNAGQSNYSAAKAGILGMTKTLAKEWGRLKVNVNAVAFGLIETRLTQALAADQSKSVSIEGREIKVGVQQAMLDGASRMIPAGRAGRAEEAAGAVYLLCTPESNFLSGQVLYCGGGPGANF